MAQSDADKNRTLRAILSSENRAGQARRLRGSHDAPLAELGEQRVGGDERSQIARLTHSQ